MAGICALGILLVALARLPAGAGPASGADVVGRPLTLTARGPVMQAVTAPVRIARVAPVPGAPDGETWGLGFSRSLQPGYDRITVDGQVVFSRYTRATGWQAAGPVRGTDGAPAVAQLAALALAPNGEGWAVGGSGQMYHREPGGQWVYDPEASAVTRRTLYSVALGVDERGVYGYAVGASLTFLRLTDGRWTVDVQGGQAPSAESTLPDLVSVTAVDRDRAWAVASGNQLGLWRRTPDGWTRQLTGDPIFDSPPAPVLGTDGGTVNQFSIGKAVSATADGAWVTGMMRPVDATRPFGGDDGAERSRPFAIRYDEASDVFTSYCPRLHQLSSGGVESTVDVCDRPFPFATGELATVQAFAGGDAVAGGFGMFRFDDGVWRREPDAIGFIASAAFTSPDEGWVASPGNVLAGGGLAFTSTTTLGHWTSRPTRTQIERWAQPATEPLEAVAFEPSGGSVAVAVGGGGTIVQLDPGVGWDLVPSPTDRDLHALAWPVPDAAWAVGGEGTILRFDGRTWSADPASGRLTTERLRGVAFAGPDRGWAVGAKGTILAYEDGVWRAHPDSGLVTDKHLNAVGVAGGDVVVAGHAGTILVDTGGGFRVQDGLEDRIRSGQEGRVPNLLSVAALPDGRVWIGGERSALLERGPGQPFRPSALPDLDGTIHTLVVRADAEGRPSFVASVGRSSERVGGPGIVEPAGWLMAGSSGGWRHLGMEPPLGSSPNLDASAQRDPALAVALDATGRRGWAVGGIPAEVPDDEHLRVTPTSSVWRVALDGAPEPSPSEFRVPLDAPPGTVSFAFLGDTACATGLCSAVLGQGSRADVVALTALRDVEEAARAGLVSFVLHGGDMRRNGLPDELTPIASLVDELSVPAFASLGDKDLFAGLGPSTGDQQGGVLPSAGYYQRTFAGRPAPWGSGPPRPGFVPVWMQGQAEADRSLSRTHYAFDVRPGRRTLARVVVLDTSRVPLATSAQNPPQEQLAWLGRVLADAASKRVPAVVVMHQPLVLPVSAAPEASAITSALVTNEATAVLASHEGRNRVLRTPQDVPGAVPVVISGGAGSPLGEGWRPEVGAYHAWQLVTLLIEPDELSPTGRAPVRVRSIPVLESVALHAPDGRRTGAGGTLRFSGLGRLPDVGGAHALGPSPDLDQSRATYLRFPLPGACGLLDDPIATGCVPEGVARPDHRFACEDPGVCAFVREDPDRPGAPYRDERGRLVPDPTSGLLCAFAPGETYVRLESGPQAARVPVAVGGGSGPCIPGTLSEPVDEFFRPAAPSTADGAQEPTVEAREPSTPSYLLRPKVPDAAAVGVVVPPLVNAAPAPPAGGAGQREEQREAATEQAEMTALRPVRNTNAGPVQGAAVAAGVTGLAFIGALVARDRRRYRPAPSYVHISRRQP